MARTALAAARFGVITLLLFGFVLSVTVASATVASEASEPSASLQKRTTQGQWAAAQQCCAGCSYNNPQGCCCGRRAGTTTKTLMKTKIKTLTVKTVTAKKTVTITAKKAAAKRDVTELEQVAEAQETLAARSSLNSEELTEPIEEQEDDLSEFEQVSTTGRLFERHLCPSCPVGVKLVKGRQNTGITFCCPQIKKKTKTVTRFKTKTVRKTKTLIKTSTLTSKVNVISGRLYKDINANKVYDNPPDQPLANQQVHVVMGLNQTGGGGVTTAARRAARVDSTCPPIAIATTDNDGQYSAGFGTIPPKTTIWIIIPGNCSQPLVSVVSSEDGTVEDPKIEVPVDVPASSTTTGILAITTAIAAPATSTPAAIAPSTTAVVAGVTTPAVLPATTTPAPAQPTTTVVPPGTTTVSQTHTAETTSMSHTSSASATTTCAPPTVTGFPLVANGNGWADSYTSYSTYAYGAAVDASGNVYVVGDYQGPYLKWDTYEMPNTTNWKMNAYIVKLNSMGHTQWAAYVDPTGLSNADDTKFQKVAVNPVDGTVWACGLTSNNETKLGSFTLSLSTTTAPSMLLAKFSPTGTVLWAYVSNGAADCKSVIVDDLGQNVYIAGEYKSGTFFGDFGPLPKYDTGVSFDFSGFVAKISTAANTFQWVATYGGQSTDYIYVDLVFSASNRIITAGEMNGNGFTYNNGTASQGTLAKGTGDTCGFVLELDTDTGNVTKALRFPSNTAGKHVSVHGAAVSNNHLFVAGHFDGDVVVDGASTSLTAAAAATYNHDIFIVKYSLSDWTFVNASRYGGDRNDKVSERFGGISIIDKATESLLLWGNSRSSWTGFNDTGSDPGCSYCMNSIVFTVDGGSMDVTAMHRLGDARNASIDYESWYGGAVASDGLIVVGYNVQPTFGPDCRWNYTNSAFRPGIDSTTEDVAIMKYNFDLTIPLPSLP